MKEVTISQESFDELVAELKRIQELPEDSKPVTVIMENIRIRRGSPRGVPVTGGIIRVVEDPAERELGRRTCMDFPTDEDKYAVG